MIKNQSLPTYTIVPPSKLAKVNLGEIWHFRELLYIFVWRDIKVRYKQTLLGVLWAIFQPFLTMVVFSLFFGGLMKVPSDQAPYPIFVYSGLIFWNYFSESLTKISNCLIENENIVKKTYFPRLILPIASLFTPAIDFFFALIIFIFIIWHFHYPIYWIAIILFPLLLILCMLSALGLGLFLCSANTKFRDVRFILPFFIQLLLFVTPVIYPVSIIPQKYQWIIYFNPMTGVISLARGMILHFSLPNLGLISISFILSLIFIALGFIYFQKTERFFADVI